MCIVFPPGQLLTLLPFSWRKVQPEEEVWAHGGSMWRYGTAAVETRGLSKLTLSCRHEMLHSVETLVPGTVLTI
jgi:hypothetical protein